MDPKPEEVVDVDIDALLVDADAVQNKPIHVCKKTRSIRSAADAKVVGAAIFDYFYMRQQLRVPFSTIPSMMEGNVPLTAEVKMEELDRAVAPNSRVRDALYSVFDPTSKGRYAVSSTLVLLSQPLFNLSVFILS